MRHTRHIVPKRKIFCYLWTVIILVHTIDAQDLSGYSLEELADVPVVSSSKQSERLFDTPASAFVFDEEAIENLPIDSVPEMLRYAPGVSIQRATNGIWGLGIRGMNSRFLGRVLFTVDEQNFYGTLYAGLFGNQHDLFFPDISSVEVVYGPGGALWGSNAANGMVNVILKPAFETENTILLSQYGSMNQQVGARTGWAVNEKTSARVFAKYGDRRASESARFDDSWETMRAGLQIDHRLSSRDLLTFSTEAYSSELGWAHHQGLSQDGIPSSYQQTEQVKGVTAQGKWTHQTDSHHGFSIRAWGGTSEVDAYYANADVKIAGLEFRANYSPLENHNFVLTAGGTIENYTIENTAFARFYDDFKERSHTFNGGLEYTCSIIPEQLDLTAGLNYQRNSHANFSDTLPSLRLLYRPDEKSRIWASVSTASRPVVAGMYDVEEILYHVIDIDPIEISTPYGTSTISKQHIYGTSTGNQQPEKLTAFELGLRRQFNSIISVRTNLYHYSYENIVGGIITHSNPVFEGPEPYISTSYQIGNIAYGSSDGVEISTAINFNSQTQLILSYALMKEEFDTSYPVEDIVSQIILNQTVDQLANADPAHLFSGWWAQKWTPHFRTDTGLRFSSGYSNMVGEQHPIWQADFKASWEPNDKFRISLVGRNLLQDSTSEGPLKDMISLISEQPREWFLEIRYQF